MKQICSAAIIAGLAAGQFAVAGDIEAGRQKSQACIACHGETGVSPDATFPHLAGQHASYLERALHDYREGRRQDPFMNPMAEPLSDQDIRDLAAFYAAQDGLVTPRARER